MAIVLIPNADFSSMAVEKITITGKCGVTLSVSPTNAGTVSGAGLYDKGASVQISAVAKTGYQFSKWSDNNTQSTRSITVNSDTNLVANFVIAYTDITSEFSEWQIGKAIKYTSTYVLGTSNVFDTCAGVNVANRRGKTLRLNIINFTSSTGEQAGYCAYMFLDESGTPVKRLKMPLASESVGAGGFETDLVEVIVPDDASTFAVTYASSAKQTEYSLPTFKCEVSDI